MFFCLQGAKGQTTIATLRLHAELGNTYQRIGIAAGIGYNYDWWQGNTFFTFYVGKKSIVAQPRFCEAKISASLIAGAGKKTERNTNASFYNETQSCMPHQWRVGYAYNYYLDNRHTTQSTGTIVLQYKKIRLCSANDGQAFTPHDRFRTGTLQVLYEDSLVRLGMHAIVWTGETKKAKKILGDSVSARYGLLDASQNYLGKSSCGIAYLSAAYTLPMQQHAFAQVGIKHEQIRNFVQNKMVHDNPLVHALNPSAHNAQIAMLDSAGNAYQYKANQKLRKPLLYWQIGLGEASCY